MDVGNRITDIYKPQRLITDYYFQHDESRAKKLERYGDFYFLYRDLKKKFKFLGSFSGRIEFLVVLPLGLFGLMSIIVLIQTNANSSYFATIALLLQHLPDRNYISGVGSAGDNDNDITIVGSPRYFWILKHIFDKDYFYKSYNSQTPIQTQRNMFIVDDGLRGSLSRNEVISDLYNSTRLIETINSDASMYDYESSSLREYEIQSSGFQNRSQI